MSEFTGNYNFIKPSETDYYDVQDFNENMDAIDTQMAKTEEEVVKTAAELEKTTAELGKAKAELAQTTAQTIRTANEVAGVSGKIGSYGDTRPETLFGQLRGIANSGNGGVRVVKSIQHLMMTILSSETANIQTVDPSRCVVIWQRMQDKNNMYGYVSYTLTATQFTGKVSQTSSDRVSIDVYIIEFY